ncbi:hypothetical protein Pth03_06040 [Planotetraspora thailandica]|uniref:Glycoprotein n=1 Tax=Planotetraspora thailandica TaxID=487172 RepID=A0A8J3V8X3_9ACTN|nr:DUF6049 family protein [Planotetraspora thailandica]GII52215.1 hypothetical protein Pth03_06040 [Planotetraspora thailandica]
MIRKAALLALLTAALLVPPSMAGTAAAAPRGLGKMAAAPANPLVIGQITPEVASDPAAPITISGTVTGSPSTPIRMRIHYSPSQPFQTRADMDRYATGEADLTTSYNTKIQYAQLDQSGKYAFRFVVTPQEIGMTQAGVYPLGLELVDGTTLQPIASDRTFLTYAPKGQKTPQIKLAVALPVIDQPHRADDTTFMNDDLHASVTSGRLARLLQLVQGTGKAVTWFVDPVVLEDARQSSAGPYKVGVDDKAQRKAPDAATAQWFDALRTALTGKPVMATPYADPDITGLVHNGLDAQAAAAIQRGSAVATSLLGRNVPASTAWPAGGAVDRDGLDELATAGVTSVLLSGSTLPPNPATTTTPGAAATVDTVSGPVTALLSDPTLSQILGGDASSQGGVALARQRFVAETAMIAFEQSAQQPPTGLAPKAAVRTIVVAPTNPLWNPDPKYVLGLLGSVSKVPWLRMTTLDATKTAKNQVTRSDLVYTDKNRQSELGRTYLEKVRKLSDQADAAATVTKEHTQLFHDAILRLTSATWRGDSKDANTFAEQVADAIETRMDDVSVINTPRAVAGSNGQVPVTVANNLDREVNIVIRVTSDNTKKLGIDAAGGAYQTDPISILKDRSQLVNVPVTVPEGGGEATISIQLLTAEGKPYGPPVHVTVRATGYTGIALAIVGTALVIMLAAVVMRILRRRSRKSFPFSPAEDAATPEPESGQAEPVPAERAETPPA